MMTMPGTATVTKILTTLLTVICVGLAFALGWQTIAVAELETALATEQRDRATNIAAAELNARIGIAEARTEEQLRYKDQQEVIDEQSKNLAAARADAANANDSAERLRKRAAALAAGCGAGPADPAAAGPGAPADSPGLVLADMLGRIDEAARGAAEFADHASTAGTTCERAYDALRRRQ